MMISMDHILNMWLLLLLLRWKYSVDHDALGIEYSCREMGGEGVWCGGAGVVKGGGERDWRERVMIEIQKKNL